MKENAKQTIFPFYEVLYAKSCCFCCLIFACFCFVSWFLFVLCFLCHKKFKKKKKNEFVLIASFTILLRCTPSTPLIENYFSPNLAPIFFITSIYFYLCALIFICKNLFLFMIICENLFFFAIICSYL